MKVMMFDKSKLSKEDSSKVKHKDPIIGTQTNYHHRPSRYCDAVSTYTFQFNQNITRKEFEEWLQQNGHRVKERAEWWSDYSEISGAGRTWIYKWISPYTD